jgi:hypothetical protein
MKARTILALIALAGSAPALAQTAEQTVAFLDKDGDGKCSLQEYLGFQVTRIAQFDTNADGVLQLSEFTESLQGDGKKTAKASFDNFNNEENVRALTKREYLGYHAYVFKTYVDANGDGFMSAAEWSRIVGRTS